jgi:hypothetical protein
VIACDPMRCDIDIDCFMSDALDQGCWHFGNQVRPDISLLQHCTVLYRRTTGRVKAASVQPQHAAITRELFGKTH